MTANTSRLRFIDIRRDNPKSITSPLTMWLCEGQLVDGSERHIHTSSVEKVCGCRFSNLLVVAQWQREIEDLYGPDIQTTEMVGFYAAAFRAATCVKAEVNKL